MDRKYIMENRYYMTMIIEHIMFPNEARLKNKTYGFNIYYDIDVEFEIRGIMK